MTTRQEEEESEEMDFGDLAGMESGPSFFSVKIAAGAAAPLEAPPMPGGIAHITHACFGPTVKKGSRTVVQCQLEEDGEAVPICVLREGSHENNTLDLVFNEAAMFSLGGKNVSTVHLSGFFEPGDFPGMDSPYAQDEEEAAAAQAEDEAFRKEIAEMKKRQKGQVEPEEEEEDEEEEEEEDEDEVVEEKVTKKGKKQKGKDAKSNGGKRALPGDSSQNQADEGIAKKKRKTKEMKTMKGGIQFRDIKTGSGPAAAPGKKLTVFYVGQLQDNTVFDKCIQGPGFSFKMGNSDVIKGWEIGLRGMKPGGKRRMIIPSRLGYGKEGFPPTVPSNANLTFTVELRSVS